MRRSCEEEPFVGAMGNVVPVADGQSNEDEVPLPVCTEQVELFSDALSL